MEQTEAINAGTRELGASMAKPLANPWRNRILAELHLRPMSPKHFARSCCNPALGDPELSTVARYFRELERWGFLEVAQELRGGKRRGAVEKIYRSTKRIHFDTPTWATLPYYLRTECSAALIMNLIAKIQEAVDSGTFDMEKDRHLSWKAMHLDRTAWGELSKRLDQILGMQGELEARPEVPSLLATTGLLAFRSPDRPADIPKRRPAAEARPGNNEEQHFLMKADTAKALANPWRTSILGELNLRPMSPNQFFHEFGGPDLPTVARYFRQLRKLGYLEVDQELRGGSRRGGVEKIYKATKRVRFTTPVWEELPLNMRVAYSATTLDALFRRVDAAFETGTFDAEVDRFLSWKTGYFARAAWVEYSEALDGLLDWVATLESDSAQRLSSDGGECIPATIALLAFRSPDELQKG